MAPIEIGAVVQATQPVAAENRNPKPPESADSTGAARRSEAATEAPPDDRVVEAALEEFGSEITLGKRRIEFSYDREASRVIVRVRSEETDEIVRQIPADDYLRFVAKFQELFGVIFDETA